MKRVPCRPRLTPSDPVFFCPQPEAVERLPDWTADEAELTSPVHPDLRFHPLGQAVSEVSLPTGTRDRLYPT